MSFSAPSKTTSHKARQVLRRTPTPATLLLSRLSLLAPVLLAPLLLFAPAVFTGRAIFWGTPVLQFVPWWHQAYETLRLGQVPLWNPLVGMGAPLLANYQSALLYPPTWIYFGLAALGGLPALAWGQALVAALHLAWAGWGMARLVRRLGLGLPAQAVAGLAYGLCGYLVARTGFLSMNAAGAWTPWVLLGVLNAVQAKERLRPVLLLGLVLGLQLLSGHAQITWYTGLLAGMWAGYWGWRAGVVNLRIAIRMNSDNISRHAGQETPVQPAGPRDTVTAGLAGVGRAWLRLGLALALGVSLSAAQLLPTAEFLQQSQRASAVEYEYAMTYSFWPWRLLGLAAPDMFGSPASGDFWGYATYWEDAIYTGLLPFLLALGALLRRRRTGQPVPTVVEMSDKEPLAWQPGLRLFLAGLFAASVLLALGHNTPVFPWLYRNAPTFAMFQAPARYLLWAEIALALLAALGMQGWRRPQGGGLYWTRLGTMGAFAVSLGAGLAWWMMGDISPSFIRATALAGLWGVGAGLLSLAAPKAEPAKSSQPAQPVPPVPPSPHQPTLRPAGLWAWAVVLFVAADLLAAGWRLNPVTGLDFYREEGMAPDGLRELLGEQRLYIPANDDRLIKYRRFFRFETFQPAEDWTEVRSSLTPNTHLLEGIASANNFDPLVPGRYSRWMSALETAGREARPGMLYRMNVGVIERVDRQEPDQVSFKPAPGHAGQGRADLPAARLRWVPCATAAGSEEAAWELVTGGGVDPRVTVVLEDVDVDRNCSSQPAPSQPAEIILAEDTPNRLRLAVSAGQPGWLVLADVWYPGWQARVDGEPVPVRRADYLFRAIELAPGEHEISFIYRPRSFQLGAGISLAAWLGLVIAGLRRWAPARRRKASAAGEEAG